MSNEKKKPKIGEGAISAYGRQGLAEIRSVIYPGSGVPVDHGIWGNRTQGEIAKERSGESRESDARMVHDREGEPKQESARDKLLAKYDSRVHEERAAGRDGEQRAPDGPSMERE